MFKVSLYDVDIGRAVHRSVNPNKRQWDLKIGNNICRGGIK